MLESQKAYQKSLAVCDKLGETVSQKEWLEMQSRLYLNLGLTYENQKESPMAKSFMEKALVIARYCRLLLLSTSLFKMNIPKNTFFS